MRKKKMLRIKTDGPNRFPYKTDFLTWVKNGMFH